MRAAPWMILLAVGLGLVQSQSAQAQGRPTLTFYRDSQVIGAQITVDDVARVEGVTDPELKARLRGIVLGRSPQPMQSTALSRPLVESALRRAGLLEELRLVFPAKAKVTRPGQKVHADQASLMAQEAVAHYLKGQVAEGYQIEVQGVNLPRELVLPAGELSMVASGRSGASLRGSVLLRLGLLVNGQEVAQRQVSAQIKLIGPVCRLVRGVERGDSITASDVEEVRDEVPPGVLRCQDAIGQSARSHLRAGALAHRSALQPPMLVARGQRVTIVYQSGALRVTAQGEAVVDGTKGQWVPIKNLGSGKAVKALVVAPGVVQVR